MTTFILSMSEETELNETTSKKETFNFDALFNGYYEPLVQYAFTMLKEGSASEDVVQSVFLDLWNDRNKINIHTSIKAYLYKGVYFKCMNTIKRQKVENKYHSRNILVDTFTKDPLIAKELQSKIQDILNSLPEGCKKIFTMSRFESLKYHEIAEKLAISPKTVENQMGKALKIFKLSLSEYLTLLFTFSIAILS